MIIFFKSIVIKLSKINNLFEKVTLCKFVFILFYFRYGNKKFYCKDISCRYNIKLF